MSATQIVTDNTVTKVELASRPFRLTCDSAISISPRR